MGDSFDFFFCWWAMPLMKKYGFAYSQGSGNLAHNSFVCVRKLGKDIHREKEILVFNSGVM